VEKIAGTTLFFIKDSDQLQQLEGGGVDVGRQFGDFLAEVFQITEVFGVGEMALVHFWISPVSKPDSYYNWQPVYCCGIEATKKLKVILET